MGRPSGPRPGVAPSARQQPSEWTDAEGTTQRRAMPRSEYARRGLIKQQMMLPGMEKVNPPPNLRRWEDMKPKDRATVENHLRSTYGITMRNAIHNHGALIDRAINTTGEEGRNFYRGGSDDLRSQAGRAGTEEVAKRGGLSFSTAAYMRAALSPRSNVHDEVTNAHKLTDWFNDRRGQGKPPKIPGLAGKRNTEKALTVLRNQDAPHAANEKGKAQFGTPTTEKISSYAQAYTHPDHPWTRTAIDTHAIGGMAPHLPKTAPLRPTGKYSKDGIPLHKPVPKSHPDWVPNQEDTLSRRGAYEFFDYAQRQAANKRGLSGTEGQSLAWHAERSSRSEQPGSGKGKKSKVKRPQEEQGHVHPGQVTLF